MDGILIEMYDPNALEDPDIIRMREGVDDEGTTDASEVETHYCEIKNVIPADGYLRIIGDNGFTDVEIRILHKTLTALGWTTDTFERDSGNHERAFPGQDGREAAQGVEWLPIESAPKDGAEIVILSHIDGPYYRRDVGRWYQPSIGDGWWTMHAMPVDPAGWVPLPPLPSSPQEKQE